MAGKPLDIWALGVTLYCFVHGHCPFESHNVLELYQKIIHEPIMISNDLSDNLKDLLNGILKKKPTKRMTLNDIRKHPWVLSSTFLVPQKMILDFLVDETNMKGNLPETSYSKKVRFKTKFLMF